MKSIFAGLSAAVNAVGVALTGYLLVAIPAILLWMITFKLEGDLAQPLSGASAAWLLGHAVPLVFSFSASEALSFGATAEAVHLPLSLPLLGLALLTVIAAIRFGWRIPKQPLHALSMLLGGTAGFALVSTVVAFTAAPALNTFVWWAAVKPLLFFIVPAVLAFLVRHLSDLLDLLPDSVANFGGGSVLLLPLAGRLATATGAAILAVCAALFAVSCLLHFAEFVRISQLLHLDVLGTVVLWLTCLLLLPVALLWTLAWLTGSGFRVGVGSSVSPFEQLLGPVPSFPMFSMIPADWGNWAFLAPLLLFLAVVTVGALFSARLRGESLLGRVVVIGAATLLLFFATAFLMGLAGGAIGPGRLTLTGPEPWLVALLVAALSVVGLALGAWIGSSGGSVAERLPGPAGTGLKRLRDARREAIAAKRPQLVELVDDEESTRWESATPEPAEYQSADQETELLKTEALQFEEFRLTPSQTAEPEWEMPQAEAPQNAEQQGTPQPDGGIADGSFGFLFKKRAGRGKPPKSDA